MAKQLTNLTYKAEEDLFILKNVVASYPHVFEPWSKDEGENKKFSIRGLLDKDTHQAEIDFLMAHIDKMCKDKWKAKIPADKKCLRDGDLTGKPEDEGKWYIATSENPDKEVKVVDNRKRPLTARDDKIYGGAVVNIMFKLWAQDNKFGKRINANLIAVQWVAEGERFGAPRVDADDHFDAFGDDDDEMGLDD